MELWFVKGGGEIEPLGIVWNCPNWVDIWKLSGDFSTDFSELGAEDSIVHERHKYDLWGQEEAKENMLYSQNIKNK